MLGYIFWKKNNLPTLVWEVNNIFEEYEEKWVDDNDRKDEGRN